MTDRSRWHPELLRRMTLDIQGVRPALLTSETIELLDELRAFRHFFRHAYGVRLRSGRVEEDVAIARQLQPLLKYDVKQFLEQFGIDYADKTCGFFRENHRSRLAGSRCRYSPLF